MTFKQRPGSTMGQQIFRIAVNGAEATTAVPGLAFTVTGTAGPNLTIAIAGTPAVSLAAYANNPMVVAEVRAITKGSPAVSATIYANGGATLNFAAPPSAGVQVIEVVFDRAKNAFPEATGYFS